MYVWLPLRQETVFKYHRHKDVSSLAVVGTSGRKLLLSNIILLLYSALL